MTARGVATRILAFVVILSVTGMAALGLFAFRSDIDALRRATQETILWSAAQLEFELSRFNGALGEFAADAPGVDARTVNNRFDLLWSRVQMFKSGTTGQRLSEYDVQEQAVEHLFASMQAAEPAITSLQKGDRETALKLLPEFQKHAEALRALTIRVLHGEEQHSAKVRENVRQSAMITGLVSLIAVALSVAAVIVFRTESARFRRLASANLALAQAAERASQAKSRFLTMMSHELRTPMNGVLGMIALAKQPGLPRPQLRLLEQAERSGMAMIEMLSDMLDFSALQDDALELDSRSFRTLQLAEGVRELFAPVARRAGVALEIRVDPGSPREIVGDLGRLRQALAHIAGYVAATAGVRDLSLMLGHDGTSLTAVLSFAYGEGGPAWHPELILGAPERGGDQFVSDALGPAVARMLVERMGGGIRLDAPAVDRVAVLIHVPAEVVDAGQFCVRIETRSSALGFICRSALREDALLHEDGMRVRVDAVILEAGDSAEAAAVQGARERFPGATVVGLGAAADPALFDAVVPLPLDAGQLRSRMFGFRLAS